MRGNEVMAPLIDDTLPDEVVAALVNEGMAECDAGDPILESYQKQERDELAERE